MNWLVRCVRGNLKNDDSPESSNSKHHGKKKKTKPEKKSENEKRQILKVDTFECESQNEESLERNKYEPKNLDLKITPYQKLSNEDSEKSLSRHVAQIFKDEI